MVEILLRDCSRGHPLNDYSSSSMMNSRFRKGAHPVNSVACGPNDRRLYQGTAYIQPPDHSTIWPGLRVCILMMNEDFASKSSQSSTVDQTNPLVTTTPASAPLIFRLRACSSRCLSQIEASGALPLMYSTCRIPVSCICPTDTEYISLQASRCPSAANAGRRCRVRRSGARRRRGPEGCEFD